MGNWTELGHVMSTQVSIMNWAWNLPILMIILGLAILFSRKDGHIVEERFYLCLLTFSIFTIILRWIMIPFVLLAVMGIFYVVTTIRDRG